MPMTCNPKCIKIRNGMTRPSLKLFETYYKVASQVHNNKTSGIDRFNRVNDTLRLDSSLEYSEWHDELDSKREIVYY